MKMCLGTSQLIPATTLLAVSCIHDRRDVKMRLVPTSAQCNITKRDLSNEIPRSFDDRMRVRAGAIISILSSGESPSGLSHIRHHRGGSPLNCSRFLACLYDLIISSNYHHISRSPILAPRRRATILLSSKSQIRRINTTSFASVKLVATLQEVPRTRDAFSKHALFH